MQHFLPKMLHLALERAQYNEQAWKNYLWSLAAGFSDVICGLLQGCIPGVSKLFLNSLLG